MYKVQEEGSFEIRTTVTFGLDDDNEPKSVTVEGHEFLTRGAMRLFAQEALDSHFGMTSDGHGFEVNLSPIMNEEHPEPEGTMTFEVYKRVTFRVPKLKEGQTRPAFERNGE